MWKFSLAQRIRMGAALAVVFLLVLATNKMDSSHFEIVRESLTSVYKDRLVAKDYIYRIARQLQIKEEVLNHEEIENSAALQKQANDSIKTLIARFSQTELTESEAMYFESLQDHLNQLYNLEKSLGDGELINEELPSVDLREELYSQLFADLDVLSKIQLEEGRKQISNSTKAIESSDFISTLEIGTLIIIGILIQLVIFYKPKAGKKE